MKSIQTILLGIVVLYSSQLFANLENCRPLDGDYSCRYQDQNLPLNVEINNSTNQLVINIAGEGGSYIIDGTNRNSNRDSSVYNGSCFSDGSIELDNYFKGDLVGSITLEQINSNELNYTLVQSSGTNMKLNCLRD